MYKNFQFPFSTKALGITFERGGAVSPTILYKAKKKKRFANHGNLYPGGGVAECFVYNFNFTVYFHTFPYVLQK